MKEKHKLRWTSAIIGIILLGFGIADAMANILPHLEATWLIVGGVLLVALAARKRPPSVRGG
jgi:hypothetical protein